MPTTVLLVDWPRQEVPRTLLAAGFAVVSANVAAGTASSYSLGTIDGSRDGSREHDDKVEILAPEDDGDVPLVITRLAGVPERVDAVALFRPQEEHARIAERAVSLRATAIWVQRGTLAGDARQIARDAGLAVIEDVPIADATQRLASFRRSDA